MSSAKVAKVLVVDDTAIYRKILSEAVSQINGLELVGTAPRGAIALQKLKTTPCDLVLLDIFMPEMDGLETLQHIKKDFPKTTVVMVSGATTRDASITIGALRNGAADFIPKPQASGFEEGMRIITAEIDRVTRTLGLRSGGINPAATSTSAPSAIASSVAVRTTTAAALPSVSNTFSRPSTAMRKGTPPSSFELLVIGVSTGGPKTLGGIIPKLPADLKVPVLIVQHMPPMFTASLAEHLDRESPLSVREAKEGEPVKAGDVLIAPGGKHMVVTRRMGGGLTIALNENAPVNSCRPAVDVLFDSVAQHTSGPVLAVILTGMGEDGARGVVTLKQKQCYCLSQSKESCVVYGMPQAIESRDLADEVIHADQMAQRITQLINRR